MEDKADKVTIENPKYSATESFRKLFKDVCEGTAKLRAGGKEYLPQFPAEEPQDWTFRRDTATLLNVTAKTKETYCGLVFQKPITFGEDVPLEIKGDENTAGLVENIDNKGNHFNVFARDLFDDSYDGWAGILVDAPTTKAQDLGQQRALGLRVYWAKYQACDITHWDYEVNPVSKRLELSLVVLRESVTERIGKFLRKDKTQYRVLFLNETRKPAWELWTEVADKKDEYAVESQGIFEKQTAIPFAVVGELGDVPPMLDLAYKNVEHYQTYSDYKSILHKTCVPMLWTAGLDGETPSNIGGSSWWKLTEGGQMGFAEVEGTSIEKTRQSLEDIKAEMAMLGLQMMMAKVSGDVTATEKMLDSIQETSSLQVRASQLKDALELALGFTAKYLGKKEGGSIELGASWASLVISPEELAANSELVDRGQMSLETFVHLRQAAGQFPEGVDAVEELKRIDTESEELARTGPIRDAKREKGEEEFAQAA